MEIRIIQRCLRAYCVLFLVRIVGVNDEALGYGKTKMMGPVNSLDKTKTK